MVKKFKAKNKLQVSEMSVYSEILDLPIDEFTEKIKREVSERIDTRAVFERNDKSSIERALAYYHGVHAHLLTEYRRVKTRWLVGHNLFKKTEIEYINFVRKELPSKTVEKQIERVAYEEHGDELYDLRNQTEALEQKWKYLFGMAENVKNSLSAIQSLAKIIVSELGVARNE